MALTPDMIDKILSEHKDLYRADDTNKTKVESLSINNIDNNNNSIDLSDVKYDYVPFSYRINNVVNRRINKELIIFAIIILTIFFTFDLIKYFKNN